MNHKPHILIDARLYGPTHTGIGRYTKNLLLALKKLPQFSHYRFTLLVYQDLLPQAKKDLGDSFSYLATDIPHYSLAEQLKLPCLLNQTKADLVHFTHFNKPLFYFGSSVLTIHDLIKHFYKGQGTTTKKSYFYWPKYLGYRLLTFINIHSTKHIIVPSLFWKKYLSSHTSTPITVTHEAVDPKFLRQSQCHPEFTCPATARISGSHEIPDQVRNDNRYILYTGNLYPHKNIEVILKALKKLPKLKLKIIAQKNLFQQRLKEKVNKMNLQNQVEFLGFLPDSQFKKVYSEALALVHPSFMEGFSLTGLEAMALNCPVISSHSSCLPEIYGQSVLYFNPHSSKQLVSQIKKLQKSKTLRSKLIKLGHLQVAKYSWADTAQKTLAVYRDVLVRARRDSPTKSL
ncbi:glycosyltransferase family 4 protein [Patescibacteria group bacterium]|nr:glycosyltransferase family 4 protein [Patescibacteria group bacterium]